jgi:ABC-type multidrug transport system fused ATPase/permease subunit
MGSAIITIILRLTPACSWLAWSVSLLIESVGVTKRAFEVVDLPAQEEEEFSNRRPKQEVAPKLIPGELSFTDYSMSYRADSPVILDGITLRVPYGSKIGIIGRTGSGKTSIVQSLFRMVHVRRGDIVMNGQSLLDAPLAEVRNLFGVVPQDPYLFAGSVRSNLDPENAASSGDIEEAMRAIGLDVDVDSEVSEGGRNLSVGERQLICLARVMIKNHPFILLDEPTSAVDNITDAKIQRALDTVFRNRTVIAIAHRLDTLSHYDMLVEIRDGKVNRMGPPSQIMPMLTTADLGAE